MELPGFGELLAGLGNAAGWTVAVAVLLLLAYGFWKGWIVPGYIYKREVERGDRAEDAVEASTRTTEQAAAATESATRTALAVAEQLSGIQRTVERLHHDSD